MIQHCWLIQSWLINNKYCYRRVQIQIDSRNTVKVVVDNLGKSRDQKLKTKSR